MNSETQSSRHDTLILFALCLGAVIFYLPYISRQFMGDDWLWLFNAKSALDDPGLFYGRPMYGYFRPLNLVWVFSLLNLFGLKVYLFSAVHILLHGVNVFLFWKVLSKFDMHQREKIIAAAVFAFYFLNVSAIGWISVGHDLWVTLLTFAFTLRMLTFIERPGGVNFIIVLLLGMAATLFKEAGFITLGMYLLLLVLKGKNPISRKFLKYSVLIFMIYFIYLIVYFKTRTVIDKDIVLGVGTITNLWYLCTYLVTPFSARAVGLFPASFIWLLQSVKIAATFIVPMLFIYIVIRKEKTVIYFACWSLMFLSTVAVFDWGMSLFDLYPERTVARFMYVAVPGFGVMAGWLVNKLYRAIIKRPLKPYIAVALVMVFAAGNWVVVKKVTGLYFSRQEQCSRIISDLKPVVPDIKERGSLVVLTDDLEKTPQIIYTGNHLEAIIFCNYDIKAKVRVCPQVPGYEECVADTDSSVVLVWNTMENRFDDPELSR